jgi:hypothetical protein
MPQETVFNSDFGIAFFAIISVFVVSTFYPLNPSRPFARYIGSSAVAMLPLWYVYELMMPSYMNIRVDLFVIIPIICIGMLVLAYRLPWIVSGKIKDEN